MTPLIIDIAHAAWAAWHSRTSLTGAFDRLRTDLDALTAGRDCVLLAADSPPYLRATIDPAYKANRHGDDPGRAAVRGFLGALRAAGWVLVGERGHEADDVIATLVTQAHAAGLSVDVATGDKDLAVLAPFCGLLRMDGTAVTPEAVEARWGVPPALVPDLLALAGDSSDNIPGARGVGGQSAALVLRRYRGLGPLLALTPLTPAEVEAEARAVERDKRNAKKPGADPALLPIAEERARDLAIARAVARIHEQREAVERSAALVRLRADLPLDLVALIAASRKAPSAPEVRSDETAIDSGDAGGQGGRVVAVGAAENRVELAGVVGEVEAAPAPEGDAAVPADDGEQPARGAASVAQVTETRTEEAPSAPRSETMSMQPIEATEIETAPTEPPRAPPAPAALALHVDPEAEPAPVSPMLDPTDPRWALALQPQSGRAAFALAGRLAATRYFGGKSPEDIAAIILMGRERGVSAMLALSSMHVIDGKVEMSATLIAALVMRSGKARVFRCVETTDTHATYEAQRVGDPSPLRVSFSAEDAKRRGLWGKGNWAKMPDVMLAHRACTKAARLVFPDVVVGLYGDDEIAEARAS